MQKLAGDFDFVGAQTIWQAGRVREVQSVVMKKLKK